MTPNHPRVLLLEGAAPVSVTQLKLEALGYVVPGVATSADDAIELAARLGADLVLVPLRLDPRQDSLEVGAQIEAATDTPVLYLAADPAELAHGEAMGARAGACLLAPLEPRAVHTTVELALLRHRLALEAQQREHWFATTLGAIADAVIAVDTDRRVVFMNGVAEGLTGWSESDAIGLRFTQVFNVLDPNTGIIARGPITMAREDGAVTEQEHVLVHTEGAHRPIEFSTALIRDKAGCELGVVLVFRDISRRKSVEAELKAALKALARALDESAEDRSEMSPAFEPAGPTRPDLALTRAPDQPVRILVVDASVISQRVIRRNARARGYHVDAVADHDGAVEAFRAAPYDLVLVSTVSRRGVSGFDTTRALRGLPRGEDVPIVALTRQGDLKDRELCLAAGMDDYVAKPTRRDALDAILERWIR